MGRWAEPIQAELSELLEQEFSIPYFEFVYDEHWDLGHGGSGDSIEREPDRARLPLSPDVNHFIGEAAQRQKIWFK